MRLFVSFFPSTTSDDKKKKKKAKRADPEPEAEAEDESNVAGDQSEEEQPEPKIWREVRPGEIPPVGTYVFRCPGEAEFKASNAWETVKEMLPEQIIVEEMPLRLFVSIQIDPKLNPDVNIPTAVRDLQLHIKAELDALGVDTTDLLVKFSSPVADKTIHDLVFPTIFVASNKARKEFVKRVCARLANNLASGTFRVKRATDIGVLQECWTLLLERDAVSMSPDVAVPEGLVHAVPADGAFLEVPDAPVRRGAKRLPDTANPPLVSCGRPYRNADHATSTLAAVLNRAGVKALSVTPMFEKRENPIMARAVRLVVDSTVCTHGKDHKMACSYVDLYGQDGKAELCCEVCGVKTTNLPKDKKDVCSFLQRFWSRDCWMAALNAVYTQLADGMVFKRFNEYGTVEIVPTREGAVRSFLKGQRYIAWEAPKKSGRKKKDDEEDEPEEEMVLHDIYFWFESLDRARVQNIAFNPQRPPGRKGDFFNLFEGLAVKPNAPASGKLDDAAPLFLNHIFEVICGGDVKAYKYVIKCLAKMVKYPWRKLGVVIVLKGKQGAGKNAFLDVMRKIFGRHGIEVTNQRHATGNFNQHMYDKIFIVLNEAVWGGDKQSEGTLKASITEEYCLIESKGVDVREGKNHWSYMISSNENWCIPASKDARRFYMTPISNLRVGDHEYFDALFGAMDKEVPEFLWFLQKQSVSESWNAQEEMPPRTAEYYEQFKQDRNHAREAFLIDQLKEYREWKFTDPENCCNVTPIIQRGRPTYVAGSDVREALIHEGRHNGPLKNLASVSQGSLTTFLSGFLGKCFSYGQRPPVGEKPDNNMSPNARYYRFESAEIIMQHLANNELKIADFFADLPPAPAEEVQQKRPRADNVPENPMPRKRRPENVQADVDDELEEFVL